MHFRGPLQLKQMAVYTPIPPKARRSKRHLFSRQSRKLKHQHYEKSQQKHAEEAQEQIAKRQMVTATIDGQVVSWENNYFGTPSGQAAKDTPVEVTATIDGQGVSWTNNWFGDSTDAPAPSASTSANRPGMWSLKFDYLKVDFADKNKPLARSKLSHVRQLNQSRQRQQSRVQAHLLFGQIQLLSWLLDHQKRHQLLVLAVV